MWWECSVRAWTGVDVSACICLSCGVVNGLLHVVVVCFVFVLILTILEASVVLLVGILAHACVDEVVLSYHTCQWTAFPVAHTHSLVLLELSYQLSSFVVVIREFPQRHIDIPYDLCLKGLIERYILEINSLVIPLDHAL